MPFDYGRLRRLDKAAAIMLVHFKLCLACVSDTVWMIRHVFAPRLAFVRRYAFPTT